MSSKSLPLEPDACEAQRFRIEKRLLLAVLIIPAVLGAFVNGYHLLIAKFLAEEFYDVAVSRGTMVFLFVSEQAVLTLSALLVWRPKGFAKPHGRVIAVLSATAFVLYGSNVLYPWMFYGPSKYLMDQHIGSLLLKLICLICTMALLLLFRRVLGVCFVLKTALVAALATVLPPVLLRANQLHSYSGGAIEIAIVLFSTCTILLFMALISKLPWPVKIPLCVLASAVLLAVEHILRSQLNGYFPINTSEIVLQSVIISTPIIFAFWLCEIRGYRVTFLRS